MTKRLQIVLVVFSVSLFGLAFGSHLKSRAKWEKVATELKVMIQDDFYMASMSGRALDAKAHALKYSELGFGNVKQDVARRLEAAERRDIKARKNSLYDND